MGQFYLTTAICALAAYVIGAMPFGFWLSKLKGIDIREHGSGNVGATNLGRALGKKWGLTCFFLDLGKGLVPVLAFGLWTGLITTDRAIGAARNLPAARVLSRGKIGNDGPRKIRHKQRDIPQARSEVSDRVRPRGGDSSVGGQVGKGHAKCIEPQPASLGQADVCIDPSQTGEYAISNRAAHSEVGGAG